MGLCSLLVSPMGSAFDSQFHALPFACGVQASGFANFKSTPHIMANQRAGQKVFRIEFNLIPIASEGDSISDLSKPPLPWLLSPMGTLLRSM